MSCLGKDCNGNNCRNYAVSPETRFCRFHQYMNTYTPEMLADLKFCGSCRKMYYIADGLKTCETCRSRDKTKYKAPTVPCKHEGCKFKKSAENDYCGKHQLQVFVDETQALGLRMCTQYTRGCRQQLPPTYAFGKCSSCLENENIRERAKRAHARETVHDEEHRICTSCCKKYELSFFQGARGGETTTCSNCREQNKVQDTKRSKKTL